MWLLSRQPDGFSVTLFYRDTYDELINLSFALIPCFKNV